MRFDSKNKSYEIQYIWLSVPAELGLGLGLGFEVNCGLTVTVLAQMSHVLAPQGYPLHMLLPTAAQVSLACLLHPRGGGLNNQT